MEKAARFYAERVSLRGGYHATYTDDLSYGRSEHAEGPTQIETQRNATPIAGMAFLEAWEATKDRLYLDAAKAAALALVRGQLCSGGWDYVIEFDEAERKALPYRTNGRCDSAAEAPPTTLDDNVTQACLRLLMRVDRELGFKDTAIHEAVRFGLDRMVAAQSGNGAWPQRFSRAENRSRAKSPARASYPNSWPRKWPKQEYVGLHTLNDNTLADCIDVLLEASRIYKVDRYRESARRGGEFLLAAQMPDPQPGWAQQYDDNLQPSWARQFEPPAVSGGETQGIIRVLILLGRETGDRSYVDAAHRALDWLERSAFELKGRRVLARFYELKTNRPLYITRGTQVQVKGLGSARIDGYELTYTPENLIGHYALILSASGLPALRRELEGLEEKPRPERLYGLSPWSGDDRPGMPSSAAVEKLISSQDSRGAWLEEGVIGRADRIALLQPGQEMTLTINGVATVLNSDDRVEVFQGAVPPRTRILRTSTFADYLRTLAAFVRGDKAMAAYAVAGAEIH